MLDDLRNPNGLAACLLLRLARWRNIVAQRKLLDDKWENSPRPISRVQLPGMVVLLKAQLAADAEVREADVALTEAATAFLNAYARWWGIALTEPMRARFASAIKEADENTIHGGVLFTAAVHCIF